MLRRTDVRLFTCTCGKEEEVTTLIGLSEILGNIAAIPVMEPLWRPKGWTVTIGSDIRFTCGDHD